MINLSTQIIEQLPAFIFWKDIRSVYLGCNTRYAKLLGLSQPHEIIGKTDFDLSWSLLGDDAGKFQQGDHNTLSGEPVENQEEWLGLPSGEKILVLVNKTPLYDTENRLIGVLGIATDITEKKQLENQILQTQAQLEGMTILSASISHELRNPLAALKNSAASITRHLPKLLKFQQTLDAPILSTTQRQLLNRLSRRLEPLVDQCNRVLDMLLSNIQLQCNPKQMVTTTPCEIAACVETAIHQYAVSGSTQSVIHWNPKNTFSFQGHFVWMVQVLYNLLKNASYAIQRAGRGEIQIWCDSDIHQNCLHIRDSGTGIDPKDLPHIFETFFTRHTNQGTGVGLAFCRLAIEAMGGSIQCHSNFGEFTEFFLTFPTITGG